MKHCKTCGIDVDGTANFCPNCGGPIVIIGSESNGSCGKATKDATSSSTVNRGSELKQEVNFKEAISLCFQNYANFNGRASKGEFWWFFLFIIVGSLITSTLNDNLGLIFNLGTIVPFVAVTTRRLHDTDRSGWLQLLYVIPLLGALVIYYFCFQDPKDPNRFD